MFKYILLLSATALPLLLHARKAPAHFRTEVEIEKGPWFTGPLISPSAHVVEFGHQNYEPYFYWTTNKGLYDQHWHSQSVLPFRVFLTQATFQFGILPMTELDISPQFAYNNTQGVHHWRIADIPLALSFQIVHDKKESWFPAVKLRFGLNIPVGKYDRLNPASLFTDVGGTGNWFPSIGIVFGRMLHCGGHHYLSWRFFVDYAFSTPVRVHDLSLYGGIPTIDGIKGTRGTVHPGNILLATLGLEYSLSLNWALALDVVYQHSDRNWFSGKTFPGTEPVFPSAEQFTLAPALEYNFSETIGLIGGPWFSIAGRNTNLTFDFISWIFAINIYH